jgi:histidine triad (HIT) family protein
MPPDCIFCRIIAGQADGRVIYRDDYVTAFLDAHPATPVHILIIPNKHIASVNDLEEEDAHLLGRMTLVAKQLARQQGVHESGYRLVVNTGSDSGQSVFHLHMHLLGGSHIGRHAVL